MEIVYVTPKNLNLYTFLKREKKLTRYGVLMTLKIITLNGCFKY